LIAKRYKGNHIQAIKDAKVFFIKYAGVPNKWNAAESNVLDEVALWAYALIYKTKID
jgi:hypothetical protein